jgi:hypothetical protein
MDEESPFNCDCSMNSDIVIQSREKLAHGMRRRGKLGHDGDEALPQKMHELGLAARKPCQFVSW